jgi:hypothetical protein
MKAFPELNFTSDGEFTYSSEGMDLRDYFAAKAMAMIPYPLTLQEYHTEHFKEYMVKATKCSYQIADAMMEARSK